MPSLTRFPVVTDQLICITWHHTVAVMDEKVIACLQRNDPTLTSLRLAIIFVNSLPLNLYDAPSFLCGDTGGGMVVLVLLVLVLVLGSCSCVCSLCGNQISDISVLGAVLATNNTLTWLR